MRTWMLTVSLLVGLAHCSAAQPINRPKLREAAERPRENFTFGIGFTQNHFMLNSDKPLDNPTQIAELLKQMKGNATDAERYERLSRLYAEQDNKGREKAAKDKAIELLRQHLKSHPNDGRMMALYGECLGGSEPPDPEAEKILRRATAVSPKEWVTWTTLGTYLGNPFQAFLFRCKVLL